MSPTSIPWHGLILVAAVWTVCAVAVWAMWKVAERYGWDQNDDLRDIVVRDRNEQRRQANRREW